MHRDVQAVNRFIDLFPKIEITITIFFINVNLKIIQITLFLVLIQVIIRKGYGILLQY